LNDYVGGQSFCCGEKELVSNNQTGDNTFETPDYEHLIFFYHPDHLGSTALVTDNDGNVVQSVAYIPYGEVFIEERNGTWNTPYLFNGKELDEETGLYYYGARYLNPTNGMWLSVDPLWEKNIDASPYSYCHGNPVKMIDPDGMDEYEVDGTGYVTKVLENKEKDVVYSVDIEGNRVNSIEFNQRIIERSYSKKNRKGVDIHIIQMRGDDNATQLFEFLANPDNFGENREGTNVEWGLTMTGEAGENGLNFLTTSHNRRKEGGFRDLYDNRLIHGYTIRKRIHNHPSNTPYPSGLEYRDADIGVANIVSKYTKGNASFSIYVAKSNTYINYDGNSLPEDFGFMPSYNLDECVVTAHQKK
jgi:RHS repeat-associated protein